MANETETIHAFSADDPRNHIDVHLLVCANCRTPLSPDFGKTALICKYCGQRHKFLETPSDNEISDYLSGDAVAVEWGGRWWSAHVIDVITTPAQEKKWKIHFEGWAPAFDDIVDETRIRAIDYVPGNSIIPPPYSSEPLKVKRNSRVPAILGIMAFTVGIGLAVMWWLPVSDKSNVPPAGMETAGFSPLANLNLGTQVLETTKVKVGDKFAVKWGDEWYRGTAMHVDPLNGEIIIRYDGWGEEYDEVVLRWRLRELR